MATEILKQHIVDALVSNHGFGLSKAQDLIEEHIDVIEANEDDMNAKELAIQVNEQYEQGY